MLDFSMLTGRFINLCKSLFDCLGRTVVSRARRGGELKHFSEHPAMASPVPPGQPLLDACGCIRL
jgi:hypothetical protein